MASGLSVGERRIVVGELSVSALWLRPRGADFALLLGHGAGAGMRHPFLERLAGALADQAIATLRYQFPYMEAGRRFPDRPPLLHATVRAAAAEARRLARKRLKLFAGGKSMGGRMTTEAAAARPLPGVRGFVLFGFPLHPPDRPATARADHLGALDRSPMLLLQGSRDALADLGLLMPICRRLDRATLHVVDAADHGFHVLKRSGRTDREVIIELASATRRWMERTVDDSRGHTDRQSP